MDKEYRSKQRLERHFLERRHLCRHGFIYTPLKNLSAKAANGQGVSLEADHEEAIEALFWSATATNPSRCAFRSAY